MTVEGAPASAASKIRNIGVVAHIDAGKTTTSERILFYTGQVHRIGEVDQGTTALDWMPEERERGITITAAATTCPWRDCQINLIDTPGHVDFTAEVERSLRVLDGAIIVFCGVAGVQAQTETVWRQADKYKVPRLVFINKLDRVGSDASRVLGEVRRRLTPRAALVQIPFGSEGNFRGVVDLVEEQLCVFDVESKGARYETLPIPEELEGAARAAREDLLERLADFDEIFLESFVSGEFTPEGIRAAIRRATIGKGFVPVLCGASFRNVGVQKLLDAVCDYLPSPQDIPPVRGVEPEKGGEVERKPVLDEYVSALAFKLATDAHGSLVYLRTYSGTLKEGMALTNPGRRRKERINLIWRMHANDRERVTQIGPGEICAVTGLKFTVTGDTLCDTEHPVLLEPVHFPNTVIDMAVEPASNADRERVGEVLAQISREDPTFRRRFDSETGQMIISGMGELQLEVICNRMRREFNLNVQTGAPKVSYRETITRSAKGEGLHKKQTGGRGQYGHVVILVEPLREIPPELTLEEDPSLILFENELKGNDVPRQFVPAIEDGIRTAAASGPIAGYPMVRMRVKLLDGSAHEVDSSEVAFMAAGSLAFREAMRQAAPVLLEPIMKLEVVVVPEHMGDVLSDLNRRRVVIQGIEDRGNTKVISGSAPLVELFGYTTTLRSLTQGRGTASLEPQDFQPVPAQLAAALVKK